MTTSANFSVEWIAADGTGLWIRASWIRRHRSPARGQEVL